MAQRFIVSGVLGALLGFLFGTAYFWFSNVHYTRATIAGFLFAGLLTASLRNRNVARQINFTVIGSITTGLIGFAILFTLEKTNYPPLLPPLINVAGAGLGYALARRKPRR